MSVTLFANHYEQSILYHKGSAFNLQKIALERKTIICFRKERSVVYGNRKIDTNVCNNT